MVTGPPTKPYQQKNFFVDLHELGTMQKNILGVITHPFTYTYVVKISQLFFEPLLFVLLIWIHS